MRSDSSLRIAPNWPEIGKITMTSQFADITSSLIFFFDVAVFLLSSLVTGSSFMLISLLVLELWQFLYVMDWPEIRKSETPTSEFYPMSRDWDIVAIPKWVRMSLIRCYWMLQNARIVSFTVSELSRENQQGIKLHPTQIRVNRARI